MNIEKAIEFIRNNGNGFEQSKLNHTLGLDFGMEDVLKGFSLLQNPDGGFPYADKQGFPSCLSNTTMALSNLIEMELLRSEPAMRAIGFLQKMKGQDDTWEENEKIKPLEPPFWDMPGDEETTIWLTAATADLLLRAGESVSKSTLDYLRGKQQPGGKFEGFIHTNWIAISIFGMGDHADAGVSASSLKYLETVDLEDWDASIIAWCIDCMKHGKAKKQSILWTKLIKKLSDTQQQDGSWPSEGGEHAKVTDTNSVLSAVMDIIENSNINAL